MEDEDEKRPEMSPEIRRSFLRKLVAVAAATGLSGLLLSKLAQAVSANNIIPSSGQATFDGPVGIATTAPETLLHVGGAATDDIFCGLGPHPNTIVSGQYVGPAMNYGYAGNSFGEGAGFFNVRPDPSAVAPNPSLRFMTNNLQRMIITNTGRLGVNTTLPAAQLDVEAAADTLASQLVTSAGLNAVNFSGDGGGHFAGLTTRSSSTATAGFIFLGRNNGAGGTLGDILIDTANGQIGLGTSPMDLNELTINADVQSGIDSVSLHFSGDGVIGECENGPLAYGVWGISRTGFAGRFDGLVSITGLLSKGGGGFRIDHPLDPASKILYHSFVESPDMMNVYNGIVTLDANGEASVALPAYFSALNKDFRYQLTPIGSAMPNLHIASKVANNEFRIAGGTPNAEVSWTVTGVRQDAFANANRITVEVDKPADKVGKYVHPELFGKAADQTVDKPQPKRSAASGRLSSTQS